MLEPLPMQPPLAARGNQLIARQRLQHIQPTRALPRGRQRRAPELVQSQLIPQNHRQPARAPLTRAAQTHAAQSDRNHVAIENRRTTVLGEQRDLRRLSRLVEHLDRAAPGRMLAIVDLAEIGHLSLNHAPALDAPVLDDRPGPMLLAILAANLVAQKHAADSPRAANRARPLVGTTDDSGGRPSTNTTGCSGHGPRKSQKSTRVGEVGLIPLMPTGRLTSGSPRPVLQFV
jgi:hypothetical protein